ncbi:hypothetical protein LLG46_05310 [bacterium]|nr:hypothetical protein [bacterium]
MNKKHWIAVSAIVVMTLLIGGCVNRSRANLPEWAPKNPSPEFCNASKVLSGSLPQGVSQDSDEARFHAILVPAWEFFGTLSSDQINSLKASKSVTLPCTSLTAKQRGALDNYFKIYRQVMINPTGEWPSDELAELYKLGAKNDLSNVDLVVDIRASGLVRFGCTIRQQNGATGNVLPLTGLGTVKLDHK